jgi:SAM-dependent methyltransferase
MLSFAVFMSDLPFIPADPGLAARFDACLDVEGKIPRALEALGPVHGRDVLLVDGDGGRRAAQLDALGARVVTSPRPADGGALAVAGSSVDVVVALWSAFRAPSPHELVEADRVLRPGGRLLVVHDYGRDDVSRLRGDLPEYGSWTRRDGWYLTNGFRIRVIHCFWTFDSVDEAGAFLVEAFGQSGKDVLTDLTRPRLSYNVAVYHRTRRDAERQS